MEWLGTLLDQSVPSGVEAFKVFHVDVLRSVSVAIGLILAAGGPAVTRKPLRNKHSDQVSRRRRRVTKDVLRRELGKGQWKHGEQWRLDLETESFLLS